MKHPISEFLKVAAVVSVLAPMPATAAGQEKSVVMLARDGSTYEIALNTVDRISLDATTVEIRGKQGESKTMSYADVDRILIGSAHSGIAELTAKGEIAVYPSVTDGPLTVAGAPAGTEVTVHDINGMLVGRAFADTERLHFDLTGARPGVMVVNVGRHVVKIIKR